MALLTDSLMLDTVLLASLVLLLFYFKYMIDFQYWKRLNIPYLEPSFPFGNVGEALTFRRPMHLVYQDIYMKIKHEMKLPYCGIFTMGTPVLILTEPELIKHIMVKDFDVFTDHGLMDANETKEPLMKNLFGLTGDEWRKMRNKMSPTFTSGRIKEMFPLIDACGRNLVASLTKNLKKEGPGTSIDVKDYLVRYMTDVIGSFVFGIEINAVENPDSEFLRISRKVSQPDLRAKAVMALFILFPKILRQILIKLNVSMMDKEVADFFYNVVHQNVKYREENNVRRNDFINIMMQLKKDDPDIDEGVITAQCFVFFIAGFDTSSSVLTHCLYELANNQELQRKLRKEIVDTKKKHGGELSYESYQEMALLDKVIKECLRLYAPLAQLDRISSRPYQIPNTDIILDAKTKVFVPLFGIHHDPDLFPEPNKFDPERFAPENVDSIPNYAYMPFGEGPRNCIGKRFGILQLKSGLALLISNFEWHPDPSNDIKYTKGDIGLRLVKPLKLKPKPLSHE